MYRKMKNRIRPVIAMGMITAMTITVSSCADDKDHKEENVAVSTSTGETEAVASEKEEKGEIPFDSVIDESDNEAMIAEGVALSPTAHLFKTSGIGPSALNPDAPEKTPLAYVDKNILVNGELPDGMTVTEAQGLNVLHKIRELLRTKGLDVQDVATMRVFLQGENGKKPDFEGWNRAYRQYFANTDLRTGQPMQISMGTSDETSDPQVINPTRPTRFAVGVAFLPVDGWLVEVEVDAYREGEE